MSNTIPVKQQKRLLRLISARADMEAASRSFDRYTSTSDPGEQDDYFLAMVVAYYRPFTENNGIGNLLVEYPSFPDFPDEDLNLRHKRICDLRHRFMSHSSLEGTRVRLLGPGAISGYSGKPSPGYGFDTQRLIFSTRPDFAKWLHELVVKLWERLRDDIQKLSDEVGSKHLKPGEIVPLDTGIDPFKWTK